MTDYTKVDAAIVADLKARPRRGYLDFDQSKEAAKEINYRGGYDRILDRRLQALRRRGLVEYKFGFWRLPAKEEAS